jgi:hypothetical protein
VTRIAAVEARPPQPRGAAPAAISAPEPTVRAEPMAAAETSTAAEPSTPAEPTPDSPADMPVELSPEARAEQAAAAEKAAAVTRAQALARAQAAAAYAAEVNADALLRVALLALPFLGPRPKDGIDAVAAGDHLIAALTLWSTMRLGGGLGLHPRPAWISELAVLAATRGH